MREICVVLVTSITFVCLQGEVPPSFPEFDNLKDIDDCKGCLVGENFEKFQVFCKTFGESLPSNVTIELGDTILYTLKHDKRQGYMAFFLLKDEHHMKNVTCTVTNEAVPSALKTTARIYVIKKPALQVLRTPETLHEGQQTDIECIIDDARPVPAVYFDISGENILPGAHNVSIDPVNSKGTHYFSLETFKREWNQENITCCIYNKWYLKHAECTDPKQVDFLYPPAKITLEIKTEQSGPSQMYAVCTLYDSNPIYKVRFMSTSGILCSERYSRYDSIRHNAWRAEYAMNLKFNITEENKNITELTCTLVSPDLNGSKINMSSTVVVYLNDNDTKEGMHWFYQWIIWTFLGIYWAVTVIFLSVCVAKTKQRRCKVDTKTLKAGRASTERMCVYKLDQMYENLNDFTGESRPVNQLNETMGSSCSPYAVNEIYDNLNKSACTCVGEAYETMDEVNTGNLLYENV